MGGSSVCGRASRRLIVGTFAAFALSLLWSPTAFAQGLLPLPGSGQSGAADSNDSLGQVVAPVLDTAASVVEKTTTPTVETTAPVVATAAPTVERVTEVAAPVVQTTTQTVAPLVRATTEATAPLLQATAPVLGPVLEAADPILEATAPVIAAATSEAVVTGIGVPGAQDLATTSVAPASSSPVATPSAPNDSTPTVADVTPPDIAAGSRASDAVAADRGRDEQLAPRGTPATPTAVTEIWAAPVRTDTSRPNSSPGARATAPPARVPGLPGSPTTPATPAAAGPGGGAPIFVAALVAALLLAAPGLSRRLRLGLAPRLLPIPLPSLERPG